MHAREQSAGVVTLGFVGDLILGRRVSAKLRAGFPPEKMWGDVRPLMQAADAVIGNLEGPITEAAKKWPLPKAFYFKADARALDAIVAGNFRCVALANNHLLDYRAEGLADTLRHLDGAGIARAGAGADRAAAEAPAIFEAGGRTIGFVSLTNTVRSFAAGDGRAGTNYWAIRGDGATLGRLARIVFDLRKRGAEHLVLSVHWGPNYRWWPPRACRAFARGAIELGFDVVHGHSAHILQPAEFFGRGLILYDTGDFIDDLYPIPGIHTEQSFLFLVGLRTDGPPTLRLVPVRLHPGEVNHARGDEARRIRDAMRRRCRGYAIAFAEEDGHLLATPFR